MRKRSSNPSGGGRIYIGIVDVIKCRYCSFQSRHVTNSTFWLFQIDMAALRYMSDNDLKELGVPMVSLILLKM